MRFRVMLKDLNSQVYRTTLGEDEVIIGDEKSASFVPQICFTKWKENSLTIKLPDGLIASSSPTLSAGKLEVKDSKTGFYFNPEGDNFKFGLILYEKPLTNTWSFQLEGWEEFDFLYQPIWKNVKTIKLNGEDYLEDIDGGGIRKPDVQGSYAVYHKSKVHNQYKTGKFCHIYRPKFIDIDGKEEWADIEIKDGIYKVTIPYEFLNIAKYPIKVNDTYGNTSVGGTEDTSNTTYKPWALNVYGTMPANGTITDVWISYRSNNLGDAYFNYYDNANNKSSASDVVIAMGNADNLQHWYDAAISGDAESSGDKLAVGFEAKSGISGTNMMYDATAGTINAWQGNTYNTIPLPDPKETSNTFERQYSVYMEYTAGGAPAAEPEQLIMVM